MSIDMTKLHFTAVHRALDDLRFAEKRVAASELATRMVVHAGKMMPESVLDELHWALTELLCDYI